MAGHQDVWRTEPDGVLAAEVGPYRLIVQALKHAGGSVRFMVLRREDDGGALALIGSGMKADLRSAMKAAARMADNLPVQPSLRSTGADPHIPHDAVVAAGRI